MAKWRAARKAAGGCVGCATGVAQPNRGLCRSCADLFVERNKRDRMTPIGRAKGLLNAAKARAKKYSLECTISAEWIAQRLSTGVCELTGIKFDWAPLPGSKINPFSPSLDRINPAEGYTPGNTRALITAMNVALNANGVLVFEYIAQAYLQRNT